MSLQLPAEMLAARLYTGEHALRVETVPTPSPGPEEVLIKVAAAGVCLSDVHLLDGTLAPNYLEGGVVTLGHEVAGTVVAVGERVRRWKTGQRALLQAGHLDERGRILTRGVDYDGGYAEYCVARAETVVPIPDNLPFEQAAIIPDAVSTPWAAIEETGEVVPGEAVGVWGLGGLGTHAVQLLHLMGAAPIIGIDPLEEARQRALRMGADACLDPAHPDFAAELRAVVGRRGLDCAFDFAGVSAVREQALSVLATKGRLVIVGLAGQPVNVTSDAHFSFARLAILGHYGSEPKHVEQLVTFAKFRRLDLADSVTKTFPLAEAETAIHMLERKEGHPIRFVLTPDTP